MKIESVQEFKTKFFKCLDGSYWLLKRVVFNAHVILHFGDINHLIKFYSLEIPQIYTSFFNCKVKKSKFPTFPLPLIKVFVMLELINDATLLWYSINVTPKECFFYNVKKYAGFRSLVFSFTNTESVVLFFYGKTRVSEIAYAHMFYTVLVNTINLRLLLLWERYNIK